MPQSPDAARTRYNAAFTSSIFEPPPTRQADAFVPAGKRRDQTTAEMFGHYAEKDLRGMPKTFVPKEDTVTARTKKLQFLSSDVLPCSNYPAEEAPRLPKSYEGYPEADDEDSKIDTNMLRQMHLSSSMFGRPTPQVSQDQMHDRASKLVPNDFAWHSHPECLQGPEVKDTTHSDRAYMQKCSQMFDYHSPEVREDHAAARRQVREEESVADQKRRANVYYSDLFGRSAEFQGPEVLSARRPKSRGSVEDQIIVHQDWTDSRTELLHGARSPKPERPHLRKHDELHQARIFQGADRGDWQPPERLDPVTHDNSQKLKISPGMTTQQIHQAHLRTSIQPEEFYRNAENSKDWEVVELHISGLPFDADDGMVRNLCQGFDLQIVKCKADIDPVRNLCKGRAKITVRYNPTRDSIAGLVRHLEAAKLSVDL